MAGRVPATTGPAASTERASVLRLTPEAAAALLWERAKANLTAEAMCGKHVKQLEAVQCDADSQVWIGARQIGKTTGIFACLWLTASSMDNVHCLYIGLTLPAVRKFFDRRWRPMLRRNNVPCDHNRTDMITTFPNGSTVTFGSTDDLGHVASLLGESMAGGVAIIDESHVQRTEIMEYLVEDVLEPMLSQTTEERPRPGKIILIGTIPETPAGYFWELFARALTKEELHEGRFAQSATVSPVTESVNREFSDGWARLNWSRFDNPFFLDTAGDLARTLKRHNTTEDDPRIQRDWYGRWLFSSSLRAFHAYKPTNAWVPVPAPWAADLVLPPGRLIAAVTPADIDCGCIALDPAQKHDRFSIQAIGWSSKRPMGVWHLAEWCTDKAADPLTSQWQAVVLALKDHYPFINQLVRDSGSNSETIDLLWRQTRLYIEPVVKYSGSRKMGVDRVNDLFAKGEAYVIDGSQLQQDLLKAKWSKTARAAGKWEWDSAYHPDPAESYRYAIERYVDLAPKPAEDTSHLTREEKSMRDAVAQKDKALEMLRTNSEVFDAQPARRHGKPGMWGRR